jgi:acetylornithine deacetylase/succinyl-diaminopimelate desuccinylase-like protein
MGHTDVVPVDPTKWKFPPLAATRDAGYVYGRGTIDDKLSVAARLDDDPRAEKEEGSA